MKRLSDLIGLAAFAICFASCTKDLNRTPITGATSATVYNTPTDYLEGLAKVYGGFALTGQQGPSGQADIGGGLDEGSSDYIRSYWEMQELPTDEAVCHWDNAGANEVDFHSFSWTSSNSSIIQGFYDRIYFEVDVANEYIRQSADGVINGKGFAASDVANIQNYRNEARFLRALTYWHALDLFGSVPFVTEANPPGAFLPKQISRDSLFSYVESELLSLQTLLPAPGMNDYGRADQGAVWTLLAKLYLNAKVYTGTDRSTDCLTYCNKIIGSNAYSLATKYSYLFLPDSHTTSKEIIFPIRMDGEKTQSYGSTNYLIHASVGGSMPADTFGINGGWAGLTATSALVNLFDTAKDTRAMFWTDGQTENIPAIITNVFTYGLGVTKYRNVSSTGARPYPTLDYVSTDYPMFRLADVYLMYAEAVLNGGTGGDQTAALNYVNMLRARAYGNANANYTNITLNDILNERARELYWEANRRTDLIRFGLFTPASYVWPWKGGSSLGSGVDTHFNLYPIPSTDLGANPTLIQNPGYN